MKKSRARDVLISRLNAKRGKSAVSGDAAFRALEFCGGQIERGAE